MARGALVLAMVALAATCSSGFILGVDFGSEFMKVALVQNGKPFEVITNIHSKRKTPTVIGFYKGERLFGADAEQISTRKPKFVLRNPQTLLGRNMSDPIVQAHAAQPFVGYDIVPSAHGGVALRLAPHEDSFPEGRTFTVEELTGMLLAYAKHFASIFAGGAPISDAIITVPAFFTQQHRLAMLDAAALAGLRVLALLDENTAAGVQYGIDKVHTNTTNLLMFNSGSARTQATVIQYTAYKAKGFGKGKVGQGEVLGACWEDGVGGASVTQALLNLLADAVNAKHSKALEGTDIRTLARPISKLLKAAKKAKEVLSANTEYTVYVESLTPNIDFSHKVRRADLEQAAAPFLAGAMKPIACALEAANLTLADIHAVELIGGSVRVPAMQALLKETFAPANLTLGMHMNGDEAMALGAAFVAANRSTSFRVRQVGMVSTTPFSVGVELTDLPGAEVDTPLSKRSTLFKAGNKLGNLKKLSLKHSTDMVASLAYTSDAPLPASAQTFLAAYNITGLAAAVANHSTLDAPKVSLTFQLDHNGIVRVTKAEAVFEEWVEPATTTPEAAKEAESSPSPTAEPASEDKDSAAEDSTAEDSPDAEGTAKDEKEDADKGADAADENTATATPEPTAIPQPKRKLIRVPLTVTLADTPDFTRAMNSSEMEASAAVLAALQAIDDAKAKREAAKSSLESYIYASRGQMGELYEEVEAVSTEEQREAISTALEETEDWLYDEGDNTSLDKYLSKDAELKALVQPVLERVKEAAERPAAIKSARKFIVSTEASLADWNETRPWLTDYQLQRAADALKVFTEWLEEKVAAQEAKEAHEEPAFTVAQLKGQRQPVKLQMNMLKRVPKPTPTPSPTPAAEAAEEASAKADTEASGADAGEADAAAGESKETAEPDATSEGEAAPKDGAEAAPEGGEDAAPKSEEEDAAKADADSEAGKEDL